MAAEDISARVTAWALDEAGKQCLGRDYGISVSWQAQMFPNGQGGMVLGAAWHLLITARSPLLGQPPLFHLVPAGATVPDEAFVRAQVADGLRQLRDLHAQQLAGANGHAKAPSG